MTLRYEELPRKILLQLIRTMRRSSDGRDCVDLAVTKNKDMLNEFAHLVESKREAEQRKDTAITTMIRTRNVVYGDGMRQNIPDIQWKALDKAEKEVERARKDCERLERQLEEFD